MNIQLETEKKFFENLKRCKTDDNIASELIVAVITLCGSIGSAINLEEIFNYYNSNKCFCKNNCEKKCDRYLDNYELNYVLNTKTDEDTVVKKAFYNCLNVTFFYIDVKMVKSKIAAKVFPNGSIQIPGCRTIDSVHNTPVSVYEFIKNMDIKCRNKNPDLTIIRDPPNFKLKDLRIVMINSNFTFCKKILQEQLKDLLNEYKYNGIDDDNVWRMISFQPEKYSGINIRYLTKKCRDLIKQNYLNGDRIPIKLDGQVSIFIFRSGKGTITGAKNTDDLVEAYEAITNFLRNNTEKVFY